MKPDYASPIDIEDTRLRFCIRAEDGVYHHGTLGEPRPALYRYYYRVDAERFDSHRMVSVSMVDRDRSWRLFRLLAPRFDKTRITRVMMHERGGHAECVGLIRSSPQDIQQFLERTAPSICSGDVQLTLSKTAAHRRNAMARAVSRSMNPVRMYGDRAEKHPRSIPPGLRARILERDEFKCRRCGVHASESRLVIDHVVPVSKGGTAHEWNLQTLCNPCNAGKSDREPTEHDLGAAK